MPSITIQNPLGAALGSASTAAGGFAQQENRNRSFALDEARQKALLEGIDEERKIAAEERMRLAQARGDHEAFFSALAEARPTDVDPDAWLKQRESTALKIAGRIAGNGGDPRGALAALEADTTSQYKELHRQKSLENLSAAIKSGQLSAPGPDGKPMDPEQDPYAGEIDAIAKELDTPGIDPGPALEKLGRIRGEIEKERTALHKREVRTSQLQSAVSMAASANLPTDALSQLTAAYSSGSMDDAELDKELPYARRGLKRVFHSDGTVGVYPFEEADQRTAEREAVIKKMDEMAAQLAQANIEKAKAAAENDRAQGRLYDAGGSGSRSRVGAGLSLEKRIDLSQKYDEMAQKAKDNGDEAGAKFYFNRARMLEMGGGDTAPASGGGGGQAPKTDAEYRKIAEAEIDGKGSSAWEGWKAPEPTPTPKVEPVTATESAKPATATTVVRARNDSLDVGGDIGSDEWINKITLTAAESKDENWKKQALSDLRQRSDIPTEAKRIAAAALSGDKNWSAVKETKGKTKTEVLAQIKADAKALSEQENAPTTRVPLWKRAATSMGARPKRQALETLLAAYNRRFDEKLTLKDLGL